MLKAERKKQIIEQFKKHENDTGTTEVQVALLSEEINELTEHLKVNKKDNHTRLGLMKLVGKRRRLLKYLEKNQIGEYRSLIKKLGIRK